MLPPFQTGSFHYLSPHPAPGDLQFWDTHLHLLLREPQGQEAGHHPGEQTDTEKRTGEGKAESVSRRHQARRLVQGQEQPLAALGGKQVGEVSRTEERTEDGGALEPTSPAEAVLAPSRGLARHSHEPHHTLAPRPSLCRMEYMK